MSTWQSSPQPDPTAEQASANPAAQEDDELVRLADIPLAGHAAIFDRIHADLQAALADIDG